MVALWEGGSIFEFDEISQWLRARVASEQTLSVTASTEDALLLEPEELLVCSKKCELPEIPLANIAICTFNGELFSYRNIL